MSSKHFNALVIPNNNNSVHAKYKAFRKRNSHEDH
jgi:hypothetical protein